MLSARTLLACVAVLAVAVQTGRAYVITVDAHAEECFFDRIEAGTKVGKSPARLSASHVEWNCICNDLC